jgi:hypothetical protein
MFAGFLVQQADGASPLFMATDKGPRFIGLVRALLAAGAAANQARVCCVKLTLFWGSANDACAVVLFCCVVFVMILHVFVFGVQQTDGASPLFMASQSGHTEAVQALLTAGAAVDQAMVSCRCDESSAKGIATSGLYACMSLLLHVLCV